MRDLVAGVVTIACLALLPSAARAANASDCSDIEVVAEAQCSVLVEPECMRLCRPTSFVLACDDECSGRCDQNASLACTHQCDAWCPYECSFDPDSFDCDATCRSDCEGACPGKCRDHPSPGWCEATCRVTCDSTCSASCDELAPSADCDTKCGACCDASCTVQRNVECEKSCKVECTSALQSGCEGRCQDTDGALFCAGQFVDTGDDVVQCVAYLASIEVPVNVDAWAHRGAPCQRDDCPPLSGLGLSCGVIPGGARIGAAALLPALAFAALVTRRRRRRRADREISSRGGGSFPSSSPGGGLHETFAPIRAWHGRCSAARPCDQTREFRGSPVCCSRPAVQASPRPLKGSCRPAPRSDRRARSGRRVTRPLPSTSRWR